MDGDPGEGIYRAMMEENGMPKLGASATTLGIRIGKDIIPDHAGMVHRPTFQPGMANGLSCSPTIQELPRYALPVECGGMNNNTVVWAIAVQDNGSGMIARGFRGGCAPATLLDWAIDHDVEENARLRNCRKGDSLQMAKGQQTLRSLWD